MLLVRRQRGALPIVCFCHPPRSPGQGTGHHQPAPPGGESIDVAAERLAGRRINQGGGSRKGRRWPDWPSSTHSSSENHLHLTAQRKKKSHLQLYGIKVSVPLHKILVHDAVNMPADFTVSYQFLRSHDFDGGRRTAAVLRRSVNNITYLYIYLYIDTHHPYVTTFMYGSNKLESILLYLRF